MFSKSPRGSIYASIHLTSIKWICLIASPFFSFVTFWGLLSKSFHRQMDQAIRAWLFSLYSYRTFGTYVALCMPMQLLCHKSLPFAVTFNFILILYSIISWICSQILLALSGNISTLCRALSREYTILVDITIYQNSVRVIYNSWNGVSASHIYIYIYIYTYIYMYNVLQNWCSLTNRIW